METAIQQAWLHILGWTLVHFLWQGTLIAISVTTVLGLLRDRNTAKKRYLVLCCGLLLMFLAPISTFFWQVVTDSSTAVQSIPVRAESSLPSNSSVTGTGLPIWRQAINLLDQASPWCAFVWIVGVTIFFARLIQGLALAQKLRVWGISPVPIDWQIRFEELIKRLDIAHQVKLLSSSVVPVPSVIGWVKPVVLVPIACFSGMSASQLEAVLIHELAHVRRHDYLVNVLQSVAETLLFYHPAVWWISDQIRIERENCCDDLAVQACGSAHTYVSALAKLEEQRQLQPTLAATGSDVLHRARRLLSGGKTQAAGPTPLFSIAVVLLVLSATVFTFAQSASFGEKQLKEETTSKETHPSPAAELIRRFDESKTRQDKLEAISKLSGSLTSEAWQKLLDIASRDPDTEVQKEAVSHIAGRADEEAIEALGQLYFAQSAPELKIHILSYLSGFRTAAAHEKMRNIARTEENPAVRQRAVDYLLSY
jgi:beta-lactamase regulating signal transducer with metallopeptidase domain